MLQLLQWSYNIVNNPQYMNTRSLQQSLVLQMCTVFHPSQCWAYYLWLRHQRSNSGWQLHLFWGAPRQIQCWLHWLCCSLGYNQLSLPKVHPVAEPRDADGDNEGNVACTPKTSNISVTGSIPDSWMLIHQTLQTLGTESRRLEFNFFNSKEATEGTGFHLFVGCGTHKPKRNQAGASVSSHSTL